MNYIAPAPCSIETLRTRHWDPLWQQLCAKLPRSLRQQAGSDDLFLNLIGRWQEPHRRYHALLHLSECLEAIKALGPAYFAYFVEACLALWYHDAIYQPLRTDNEGRSANLAQRHLTEVAYPDPAIARVVRYVHSTAHLSYDFTILTTAEANDAAHLCDIDLLPLALLPKEFDRRTALVRDEYRGTSEDAFRRGRAHVLEHILSRQPIFRTTHYRERYEEAAKENLARSIRELRDGVPFVALAE